MFAEKNLSLTVYPRIAFYAGAGDWRQMADSLGYSQDIPLWMQKSTGAKNVIELFKTTGKTIQDLYETFYKMKRFDLLTCMEDPQYLKQ